MLPKIVGVDWQEVRVVLLLLDGRTVERGNPEVDPCSKAWWVQSPFVQEGVFQSFEEYCEERATPEPLPGTICKHVPVKWVPKLEPEPGAPFYGVTWGPMYVSITRGAMKMFQEIDEMMTQPDHVVEEG